MKTEMTIGYSPLGGNNQGIHPFDQIFDKGVNLLTVPSLKNIDALLLWGGTDISPSLYGEEKCGTYTGDREPSNRDLFEWHLLIEATQKGIPIIGVCRGAQLACAFAGGKLVQDCFGHQGDHRVTTWDGKEFTTPSAHHQMMFPYATEHELLAWSKENRSSYYKGLTPNELELMTCEPEVVYFPEINAMAIQGHPEWRPGNDPFNKWLLDLIVDKCYAHIGA